MGAVEVIEKNKVRFTFSISPERFQEGLKYSYNRNKNYVNIPGFRKGKAPRKVIERSYGRDFFYADAVDYLLHDAYIAAVEENGLEPVFKPEIHLGEADEAAGVTLTAEVFIKPDVEIDGYHGLTYPAAETEPAESDIQEKLQAEREKNARLISVERPAENGDMLTINFNGFVDGEPFEGGEGENYDLTLGSHTFIDTFEEQLAGHVVGDDITVNVTFPEDYGHTQLAGKPARFEVEILDVKTREYPEVNDEFAQDVSEFETLAEYRESLTEKIREEKIKRAEQEKERHVVQQLIERAVMEAPEVMYTQRLDDMIDSLRYDLKMQGMTLEVYLQFMNMTEEALKANYYPLAKENVDGSLALEAVAKKESMSVSDEEYRADVERMAESAGTAVEAMEKRIDSEYKKIIMLNLLREKALAFVMEKAVAV